MVCESDKKSPSSATSVSSLFLRAFERDLLFAILHNQEATTQEEASAGIDGERLPVVDFSSLGRVLLHRVTLPLQNSRFFISDEIFSIWLLSFLLLSSLFLLST